MGHRIWLGFSTVMSNEWWDRVGAVLWAGERGWGTQSEVHLQPMLKKGLEKGWRQ